MSFVIARTWKRDGSVNLMSATAAARNLAHHALARIGRYSEDVAHYLARLRNGDLCETPLAYYHRFGQLPREAL